MNCADVRERLAEFALGVSDAEERSLLERHLEWCAGCRKEAGELLEGAVPLALALEPVSPPPSLEERVVRTVMTAAGTRPHRARRRGARVAAVMVLAAAISAATAVGWGVAQRKQADSQRTRAIELQQKLDDTGALIADVQRRLQGSGKLFQASLYPGTAREQGGSALVYSGPKGTGFLLVDVVAPMADRSGPFTVELLDARGQRETFGALARTNNGDWLLYRDIVPDPSRQPLLSLSAVTALTILDRSGEPVLTGLVRPYVAAPATP